MKMGEDRLFFCCEASMEAGKQGRVSEEDPGDPSDGVGCVLGGICPSLSGSSVLLAAAWCCCSPGLQDRVKAPSNRNQPIQG